jgi:uncharacterized protein YggE
MKTHFLLLSFFLTSATLCTAQQSGNYVYGQSSGPEKKTQISRIALSDSTIVIEANVMMNVIADSYSATFGVSEEAASIQDCNTKIDKRIQDFIGAVKKLGYTDADFYVDMTTQNKVLDYNIESNVAKQYVKGFELKKNVILKLKSIGDLDKAVILASNFGIYDLVKVDYIVSDIQKMYTRLFEEAGKIINKKKELYVGITNARLKPAAQIYAEEFYTFYPNNLYKSYSAFESSDVYNNYNSSYIKKDLRKSATFYYDKASYSGFDTVINPDTIEPAVEFVLTLQIRFETEKAKK